MDADGNVEGAASGPSVQVNHNHYNNTNRENPILTERYTKLPETPPSKKLPAINHGGPNGRKGSNPLPPIHHSALDSVKYPKYSQRQEFMPNVSTPTGSVADSSIRSDMSRTRYEAESPDELALVRAASTYNCCLKGRSAKSVIVWLPGEFIKVLKIDFYINETPVHR